SAPTAPYHERQVIRAIESELRTLGIATNLDAYGQLHARIHRGNAAHPFALVAHTDHPAFDITSARGREGRARVLGGFYERLFAREVRVRVHDDDDGDPFGAVLDDWTRAPDVDHNSLGNCRIRADRELRAGQFAVIDIPSLEALGDELRLRVARERLAAAGIPTQRALLTGGTCESSAFVRMGWTTTAIALPNVNYHNMADDSDEFVPEIVRLSDLRGAVALLVEAAAAGAADEDESWWPDVRRVPEHIRTLMRGRQ